MSRREEHPVTAPGFHRVFHITSAAMMLAGLGACALFATGRLTGGFAIGHAVIWADVTLIALSVRSFLRGRTSRAKLVAAIFPLKILVLAAILYGAIVVLEVEAIGVALGATAATLALLVAAMRGPR